MANFYENVLNYAKKASAALDIPTSVILAQWANESARGTSNLAVNANNLGGIKYVNQKEATGGKSGAFAKYNSIGDFVSDYIRVMKLSYYTKVRDAVSVDDTVKALSASPYAEGGYSGGSGIMSIIKGDNLTKYDTKDIIGNDGTTIKNVPVTVPQGASNLVIGIAVVAAGLALLQALD